MGLVGPPSRCVLQGPIPRGAAWPFGLLGATATLCVPLRMLVSSLCVCFCPCLQPVCSRGSRERRMDLATSHWARSPAVRHKIFRTFGAAKFPGPAALNDFPGLRRLFCFVLFCFVLFCVFCFVVFSFVLFCFVKIFRDCGAGNFSGPAALEDSPGLRCWIISPGLWR